MPVTALFIAAKTLIIDILYSSEFYDALAYVSLAIIGVGLRGASWCMAYAILARGDGKIYVLTELSSAAAYLLLNIPLYHYYGYAASARPTLHGMLSTQPYAMPSTACATACACAAAYLRSYFSASPWGRQHGGSTAAQA